jgi:Glycosyl hydrolase family 26
MISREREAAAAARAQRPSPPTVTAAKPSPYLPGARPSPYATPSAFSSHASFAASSPSSPYAGPPTTPLPPTAPLPSAAPLPPAMPRSRAALRGVERSVQRRAERRREAAVQTSLTRVAVVALPVAALVVLVLALQPDAPRNDRATLARSVTATDATPAPGDGPVDSDLTVTPPPATGNGSTAAAAPPGTVPGVVDGTADRSVRTQASAPAAPPPRTVYRTVVRTPHRPSTHRTPPARTTGSRIVVASSTHPVPTTTTTTTTTATTGSTTSSAAPGSSSAVTSSSTDGGSSRPAEPTSSSSSSQPTSSSSSSQPTSSSSSEPEPTSSGGQAPPVTVTETVTVTVTTPATGSSQRPDLTPAWEPTVEAPASPVEAPPVPGQPTAAPPVTLPSAAAGQFHGWTSGAAGEGMADGSFGSWRGSPVTIVGTWNDTDAATQTKLPTLTGEYASWPGDLDIAVGGTVLGSGESYEAAASGAYQARWTEMAQTLQRIRGDKPGITYVRPFHEFNGDWYRNWQVTPANLAAYQSAFRRMAQTIRTNCPRCMIVWSPNNGTSGGSASPREAYPGDDVVDVVGVDSYNANGNTVVTSARAWNDYANATRDGAPVGVEMWRQFAEQHGKPMSLSEWGLNSASGGGDNPEYIRGMHDWIEAHAARPGDPVVAGRVVYDVYFNIAMGGNRGFLIKDGPNGQASSVYRSLRWGNATDGPAPAAAPSSSAPFAPTVTKPASASAWTGLLAGLAAGRQE